MKNLFLVTLVTLFSFNAFAQYSNNPTINRMLKQNWERITNDEDDEEESEECNSYYDCERKKQQEECDPDYDECDDED